MTLVCLAGEQPMANAIVVRELEPDRLIILHSSHHEWSFVPATRLRDWALQNGLDPTLANIGDGMRFGALRQHIEEAVGDPDGEVVVNITSGTKLMGLAAAAVANQHGWDPVYLDTRDTRLYWLNDGNAATRLQCIFEVDETLALHGYRLSGEAKVTDELIAKARLVAKHREFDFIVCPAGDSQLASSSARLHQATERALINGGVLDGPPALEGGRWHYPLTPDGAALTQHKWHEYLAAEALELAGADEIVTAGQIDHPHDELDAIAAFGLRLVLVECKGSQNPLGQDALKALATDARAIGGNLTMPVYAWCPSPAANVTPGAVHSLRERCDSHGVRLYIGSNPNEFAQLLRSWLDLDLDEGNQP